MGVGIEIVWESNVARIANAWLNGVAAVVFLLSAMTTYGVLTQSPRDAIWFLSATCITWVVLITIESRLKKRAKAS